MNIMDNDAKPLPKGFDMDKYLNTFMRMYASETAKATLIRHNSVMDAIIDRFGKDVEIYSYDMDNFKVEVDVAANKLFYMWIFGFGGMVKIKAPDNIKTSYCEMLRKASESI